MKKQQPEPARERPGKDGKNSACNAHQGKHKTRCDKENLHEQIFF
jgi:hypothetical protein